MSAASIIKRVRDAGGEIRLAEDRIRLRVPASLQDALAAEIRDQRDAIKLALKRETGDAWDADDYRQLYDERAGVAEFDGGLTREEAEASAFETVVVEWLDRHQKSSPAGQCAWCRRSTDDGRAVDAGPTGTRRKSIKQS